MPKTLTDISHDLETCQNELARIVRHRAVFGPSYQNIAWAAYMISKARAAIRQDLAQGNQEYNRSLDGPSLSHP